MANEGPMRRFSSAQLEEKRVRGESLTDRGRVIAKTEAELDDDIASDPDWRDVPKTWHEAAEAIMPVPKQLLSLRLDADVVEWFRAQGPGYQTRMNAVLRSFVFQHHKRRGG